MKQLITGFALIASLNLSAQQVTGVRLTPSTIADSLSKGVDAVYRVDEMSIDIESRSSYTSKVHQVYTILNEGGAAHLNIYESVGKFNRFDEYDVRLLNSAGVEVKKYKKKDFAVQMAFDGVTLVSDAKVMHLEMVAPGYPCTVEVNSEESVSGYIDLPDFTIENIHHSTERFRFAVNVPASLDIRHRTRNIDLKPVVNKLGDKISYLWEGKNIASKNLPEHGFQSSRYVSMIEIAPNVFEYDGYPGALKDWKSFGEWSTPFYDDKNPFSEARISEIKSLASTQKTDADKIRVLYNYMKANMRYVSIQLGIGGFKPFPASFVDSKKYGDCKALTNYMHHMLKVVGINSYPALINSSYDSPPVDPSFPTNRFNHVILCVPQGKDSIWLECTSNFNSAGFLGTFTENKNALLITEKGGVMVRTPRSNYHSSRLVTNTTIEMDEEGAALARSSIFCSGDELSVFEYIRQLNSDQKKTALVKYLDYRMPDDFSLDFKGDSSDGYKLEFQAVYTKLYDFKAGSKHFFQQGIYKLSGEDLALDSSRTIEYVFDHPYEKLDTTVYLLPKSFVAESLLPVKEIKTDIASYRFEMKYDKEASKLFVITYLALHENQVKPSSYLKLAEFFNAVNRSQDQKFLLKKE